MAARSVDHTESLRALVTDLSKGDVSLLETFKGVVPFLIAEFLRVSLIIAFPAITLVLIR